MGNFRFLYQFSGEPLINQRRSANISPSLPQEKWVTDHMEQTCGSGGGEQAQIPKAETEAENSQGNYLSSTNPSQF